MILENTLAQSEDLKRIQSDRLLGTYLYLRIFKTSSAFLTDHVYIVSAFLITETMQGQCNISW